MRRLLPYALSVSSVLLMPGFIAAQQPAADSSATILRVQLDADAKVKLGAPVHARIVDSLYSSDRLVLPAGSVVTGQIAAISNVPRHKRLDAISHGDFTPLHEASIEFETITLSDGVSLPISASPASQSGDVLRFQTSPPVPQSLFHQAWATLINRKTQTLEMIKAPGRMTRLKKILYTQLPWHPQAIESGTQYDVMLLQPIPAPTGVPAPIAPTNSGKPNYAPSKDSSFLHARLQNELSSRTAQRDDPVAAVVTQPVLNAQGNIEIPQGAMLHGRVLQTRAAKKWGRNGALRFTFSRVDFPQGQGAPEQVAGVPAAVDGSKNGSLRLDAEGGVQPDTNKGVMLPLVMGWLVASSIFDEDAGAAKIGVTSNGFGLITRLIAISTGSRYIGAAIGSVATVRTIYSRFLAHGRDVSFARNSEIEVELGPLHGLAHPPTH